MFSIFYKEKNIFVIMNANKSKKDLTHKKKFVL